MRLTVTSSLGLLMAPLPISKWIRSEMPISSALLPTVQRNLFQSQNTRMTLRLHCIRENSHSPFREDWVRAVNFGLPGVMEESSSNYLLINTTIFPSRAFLQAEVKLPSSKFPIHRLHSQSESCGSWMRMARTRANLLMLTLVMVTRRIGHR